VSWRWEVKTQVKTDTRESGVTVVHFPFWHISWGNLHTERKCSRTVVSYATKNGRKESNIQNVLSLIVPPSLLDRATVIEIIMHTSTTAAVLPIPPYTEAYHGS